MTAKQFYMGATTAFYKINKEARKYTTEEDIRRLLKNETLNVKRLLAMMYRNMLIVTWRSVQPKKKSQLQYVNGSKTFKDIKMKTLRETKNPTFRNLWNTNVR